GDVDTIILLRRPKDAPGKTIRQIICTSRLLDEEVEAFIKLTNDGYEYLGEAMPAVTPEALEAINAALPQDETSAISLDGILQHAVSYGRLSGTDGERKTLRRTLHHLEEVEGTVKVVRERNGQKLGVRNHPFLYYAVARAA